MVVTHHQDGDFTVFSLVGRFDAFGVREFKNVVSQVTVTKKRFIIEMAGVNFIDSSGLGTLVGILRTVEKEGGQVRIAGLIPEVLVIFELTRLHRIFDIYETAAAAMAAG
jgi:anti-sigma B factor antagonist